MLKFFYRLKRRHGVVLFAVIAIMTLLIAMATTAYFTARASYQTVVSNYDFSQTYLSAISISDMLIEAVTQDTNMPGTVTKDGSGKVTNATLNFYQKLKDEVQKLKEKTPGSTEATITGYSHNVSGHTASTSDILDAAANNPVASGIFDAVKVEISHVGTDEKEPGTGLDICHFTFTTTVYYRGTTITVEDTVINKSGTKTVSDENPFSRFFTSTALTVDGREKGTSRVVLIDTHDISSDAYFENDYTIFGLEETAGQHFHGSLTSSGSVYLYQLNCSMPATNSSNRNDWFIGKNLVLGANADTLDLNGSDLYVGGDLVITASGTNIKAANVYVGGNIYYVNGTSNSGSIQGNLFIGNPNKTGAKGEISGDPSAVTAKFTALNNALTGTGKTAPNAAQAGTPSSLSITGTKGVWNGSKIVTISNVVKNKETDADKYIEEVETGITLDSAMAQKTEQKNYSNYTAEEETLKNVLDLDFNAANTLPQSWEIQTPESISNAGGSVVKTLTPDSEGVGLTGTATWSIKSVGGTLYAHYEVSATEQKLIKHAWENGGTTLLTDPVDVSYGYDVMLQGDGSKLFKSTTDGVGSVKLYNNGDLGFESTNHEWAKISKSGDNYTIDLPASTTGYLLGLNNVPNPNGSITYNVHTIEGESTPIVLKANFNDGSGLVGDDGTTGGNNAFSWRGNKVGASADDYYTAVKLVNETGTDSAKGNIIFEVGNYRALVNEGGTPTGEWGYVKYKRENDADINVPTYYEGERFVIGTKNQVTTLLGDKNFNNDSLFQSMYDPDPYAKEGYENRIMLVSNKNNGIAFDGSAERHVICGYLYAPNGVYKDAHNSMTYPVFGGMIVSVYDTKQDKFYYCSPDPRIIKSLLAVMDEEGLGGHTTTVEGIWYTSADYGKNYLG